MKKRELQFDISNASVLGRFLSADPVLQFPENSQNYNKYSYVMNNPMRYVDPSGYELLGGRMMLVEPDLISMNMRLATEQWEAWNAWHYQFGNMNGIGFLTLNDLAMMDWTLASGLNSTAMPTGDGAPEADEVGDGGPYDQLNQTEKDLIKRYPLQAMMILFNKNKAEEMTTSLFGGNFRNDASDAFRHAYWNALNAKYCGYYIAMLFGNAHEDNPIDIQHPLIERNMDLFNNSVGMSIGIQLFMMSDEFIAKAIYWSIANGKMRIIYNGTLIHSYIPN